MCVCVFWFFFLPRFVAPEVLNRETYTTKVDIWFLGGDLFYMLSGTHPFQTNSAKAMVVDIENGRFDNFTSPNWMDVSEIAKNLIKRMLTVDVASRPSIGTVLQDEFAKHMTLWDYPSIISGIYFLMCLAL